MRIFSAALLCLAATGCSRPDPSDPVASAAPDNRIGCSRADAPLRRDCAFEQVGRKVTVWRSDSSFRRFELTGDGTLRTADGAEDARALRAGDGRYEMRVGDDYFYFAPGQLKP